MKKKRKSVTSPGTPRFWIWNSGIGNVDSYTVVYLDATRFYLKSNISSENKAKDMFRVLKTGKLLKGTYVQQCSVNSLKEFRCSDAIFTLEAETLKGKSFYIRTNDLPVYREIYEELRARLAPDIRPVPCKMSAMMTVLPPAIGLGISVIVCPILISMAGDTIGPDGKYAGSRSGILEPLVETVLYHLGTGGTILLSLLVIGGLIAWIVNGVRNPAVGEKIEIG